MYMPTNIFTFYRKATRLEKLFPGVFLEAMKLLNHLFFVSSDLFLISS
jgi:hypothetical protein